ncbi:hypothetical protein K461DRAFT_143216 [Myriangium duriaei CBS 260.36]|uniref:Uncharacterized protein n=1 Tax=Myriangium duriaei CBS 260.36 TaxID=1168546 RepID=A0A9P4J1W0_9PEZI|nr:hypothetical protein K461DRAFT_143216 [Myriangium duriaei CBS 260.36]
MWERARSHKQRSGGRKSVAGSSVCDAASRLLLESYQSRRPQSRCRINPPLHLYLIRWRSVKSARRGRRTTSCGTRFRASVRFCSYFGLLPSQSSISLFTLSASHTLVPSHCLTLALSPSRSRTLKLSNSRTRPICSGAILHTLHRVGSMSLSCWRWADFCPGQGSRARIFFAGQPRALNSTSILPQGAARCAGQRTAPCEDTAALDFLLSPTYLEEIVQSIL